MKDKKPMSSEQKTTLIAFIIVCSLFIVIGSIFLITTIVKKVKQDPDGFNKNFEMVAESYKINSWRLNGNEFRVDVDDSLWRSLSYSKKEEYCNKVFGFAKELLWKHHFFDEPDAPNMKFYNGTICAEVLFDRLVVY